MKYKLNLDFKFINIIFIKIFVKPGYVMNWLFEFLIIV